MVENLIELLRWYSAMGVDMAVDAEPHDRLAECATAKIPARGEERVSLNTESKQSRTAELALPKETPDPPRRDRREPAVAVPAETLEQTARESAATARNLAELREKLLNFDGCGLKATATQLVFGDGNPHAEIMFVGEAPGADEDRQGVPFVGRAGQLLDKMLAAIALDRSKVYIANVVPWRPPGNRTPTPLETAVCLPFTQRQIELVHPKILVFLGAASAQALLGAKEGIMRLRGRWLDYSSGPDTIKALAMLHPAYLLRQPAQKKLAWRDLRLLANEISRMHPSPRFGTGETNRTEGTN